VVTAAVAAMSCRWFNDKDKVCSLRGLLEEM
jgi:hypothetical protein